MYPMATAQAIWNQQLAQQADERHKAIIDAYAGGKTQSEVGREFGMSRERVRQILQRARERGLLNGSSDKG